jgi:Ca-activated chloride channel family protein
VFSFHWPWLAILLPVPLLVRMFWPRKRAVRETTSEAVRTTLLHPSMIHLQEAFVTKRPGKPLTNTIYSALLGLLWALLVLALMRPQWLVPHTEVKTAGYDLMLAVDTSRSMTALDFTVNDKPVSRMAVVKGVIDKFIQSRAGDRIGLTIFGNQAFVLSPLTLDGEAVRRILDEVLPGMAGDATAIGDGIGLSVKKLRDRPKGSRVLILVTDGENTSGVIPPIEAARLAAREGIRIYTIGVGTNQKELQMLGRDGRYHMETDVGLDEDVLRKIAETTGGAYFRATNARALEEIYQQIDKLEKTEAESRTVMVPSPLFRWPLGAALLVLVLIGLFPERRIALGTGGGHA